jgi:hypothetical protein
MLHRCGDQQPVLLQGAGPENLCLGGDRDVLRATIGV